MLKSILLILTIFIIIFATGCSDTPTTSVDKNNSNVQDTTLGPNDNNNQNTSPGTENPTYPDIEGSNPDIESPGPNIENTIYDASITPTIEDQTEKAKSFLKKFENKTEANHTTSALTMEIKDGGKTIIYDDKNPNNYKEYKFQSAKDNNTAYYYQIRNPKKDFNNTYIDKDYYFYCAFEVKNGELIQYGEYNDNYRTRSRKFHSHYFDERHNVKPGFDAGKIDFGPSFPNKSEIDFTKSLTIGTLR